MPRVTHVQCARKDVPDSDIKAGESYYWWAFRYGGKRVSRTYPKPWQLTQSAFLQTLYQIEDDRDHLQPGDGLQAGVEDLASRLEDLRDETQEKLDNMSEGLQQGDTGQQLTDRIDGCDNAANEFNNIDWLDDVTKRDLEEYPEEEDYWNAKMEEVNDVDLSFG